MSWVQVVIVVSWLITFVAAVTFLLMFGFPWRYFDRNMAWHLVSMAVVAVLEVVALVLTGWSLVPAAIAYTVAAVVMCWRTGLLIATRRRARSGGRG